jgi:hypothetical protein
MKKAKRQRETTETTETPKLQGLQGSIFAPFATEPQKSTSSASKANTAKGYLKTVLIHVQKAAELMPEFAYLTAIIAVVIEGKPTETQQILQKITAVEAAVRDLKTPMKTATKSYAEVLQGTKQPPVTTQGKGKKASEKTASTPKAAQTGQKTTVVADRRTVMVLLKKGTKTPDFQGL